jgi:hypothetical protein
MLVTLEKPDRWLCIDKKDEHETSPEMGEKLTFTLPFSCCPSLGSHALGIRLTLQHIAPQRIFSCPLFISVWRVRMALQDLHQPCMFGNCTESRGAQQ